MGYFLRFLGWLILYSLIYFLALDIIGLGPGKEPIVLSVILLLVSIPAWWFSWKKFEKTFADLQPEQIGDGKTSYAFSLRNPALMYYLMVLKLFLLAMGANGIITLSHHEGILRTFYIWNFIILYLYAIPFFVIKFTKLKKAIGARLIVDNSRLSLQLAGATKVEIDIGSIDKISVEEATRGMLVESGDAKIYLGGQKAKGSGFYVEGVDAIYAKLKESAGGKVQSVDSIKDALKEAGFTPVV